jgi:copper homeostasis protein
VVFHRAFDLVTDRRVGLQDLIAAGCDRVVTSGGRRLALDGLSELDAAVRYGGWDIEVVAAGGISPGTVGCVVRESGCRHVLVAARRPGCDRPASARVVLGRAGGGIDYQVTDPGLVRATAAALRRVEQEDGLTSDGDEGGRAGATETESEDEPVGTTSVR